MKRPEGQRATPDVELVGLTKRFGDVVAVDGVHLVVEHGEFVSLLGPSGCGKTTTLRMIAGFERQTSGRILIGGADAADSPPYRRDVNTVFQHYALFPHLSVLENVEYGLKQRRLPRGERRARAHEALELVQLAGKEARRPSELSGGQQQRVALARALVMQPRVLLLDEPLGALDLKLRREMQIELKALQVRLGISFVYVTHDQDEAMAMSDRIVVMREGRIEQVGPPREIYDRPATRFAAEFVGDINVIEAEVREDVDGLPIAQSGALQLRVAAEARVGDQLRLGLRPERITVSAEQGDPSAPNTTVGRIAASMVLGAELLLVITLADGMELRARRQRTGSAERLDRFEPGDAISLAWADDALLILEHRTHTPAPQAVTAEAVQSPTP